MLRCLLHVQATLATANDHQGYYLLNKVCINFGKKSLTYLTRALQEEGEGEGGGGYFNFVPILDISDVLVITTPLTQVMVSDACVWVQQVSDRHWNQFSTALGAAMVAVEQKGIATGVGGKMATQIAKAEAALAAEMASDSDDEEDESESSEDDSSEDNS